jgi:hypothetical protein
MGLATTAVKVFLDLAMTDLRFIESIICLVVFFLAADLGFGL